MEEVSKRLVKLSKIVVKYAPILIAIGYFVSAVASCFNVTIGFLVPIYKLSILSFICLLTCSKLLKFCIWHRLPLYYSVIIDLINAIDFYFVIPIESKWLLLMYLIVTCIFVLSGAYLKNRYNKTSNKM